MALPNGLRPADLGGAPGDVANSAGASLFKSVELNWSKPILWTKGRASPTDRPDACLYIIMHDHGNAHYKARIRYVGLSKNPAKRFLNHPKAHEIVSLSGQASISFAFIDFIRGKNKIERQSFAMEEIGHLLIWTLWPTLLNERKMYTLPGMGPNGGNAWQIKNDGYRFHGQMPRQIVYPWLLVQAGRDRSAKS
jgi:hypothetical protein